MHCALLPRSWAWPRTGRRMEARMAIIAITTSNSIKVNPEISGACFLFFIGQFSFLIPQHLLRQDVELLGNVGINYVGGQIEIAAGIKGIGQDRFPLADRHFQISAS